MLRMISTLTGSFVLQQFKHGNMVEIHIPFQSWLHWLAAVAPWYRSQGSGHRWSSVEDRCLPGSDSCSPAWWQILKNTSMHKLGNYHSWVISSSLLPGDGYQNMQHHKEGFPDTNLKPETICRHFNWRKSRSVKWSRYL